MNQRSWKQIALQIWDAEDRVRFLEVNEAYEEEYQRAVQIYREHLLEMKRKVEEALATLPEPEPAPEKVAGYISPNVWA